MNLQEIKKEIKELRQFKKSVRHDRFIEVNYNRLQALRDDLNKISNPFLQDFKIEDLEERKKLNLFRIELNEAYDNLGILFNRN
jgi:hypothetical protein